MLLLVLCGCYAKPTVPVSSQGTAKVHLKRLEVVRFTPEAVDKIRAFQAADGGKYVRVDVLPGFIYDVRLEDTFNVEKDFLFEQDGIEILVDIESQPYLQDAKIGWRTQPDGREGFYFENPNALETNP